MVTPAQRLRTDLGAAVAGGEPGLAAADRLCVACVDLLHVDGAGISLMHDGATRGTFGASGQLSRRLDELQFTFGEGPCLEAVITLRPVLVADFDDPDEVRWPAFAGAVLESGMRAVYALPITIARVAVGALDLFRYRPGALVGDDMIGSLLAAQLSELPLLDLMAGLSDDDGPDGNGVDSDGGGWDQLASLNRVEVHQATGMIVAALNVGPVEALARLRAHAIGEGLTASECAWQLIERRMRLDGNGFGPPDKGARHGGDS